MSNVRQALEAREMELGPDPGAGQDMWRHWRLSRDDEDVAWLIADCEDASVNTLSKSVLVELGAALEALEREKPRALVIRSAKPAGFFAGADISEFENASEADARSRIEEARAIVERVAAFDAPTIAVLHGHVLGGGLELALACDHRIVAGKANLAFPEVQLGLHPGLGGVARLTGLIDSLKAMRLMLTGKSVDEHRALALGLVDAATEERHVRAAVRAAAAGELKQHKASLKERVREPVLETKPARKLAAERMRAEAAKQAPPENYPAPGALIDLWERDGHDVEAMRDAEAASFARLLTGDTARNLIRAFHLREKMKRLTETDAGRVRHVHVIGAGSMGGDIAAWCAWHGLRVSLTDTKMEAIGDAIKRAIELYPKLGHDRLKTRDALDRLIPDPAGDGVSSADVVIEAAPEDAQLKKKIYGELEPKLKEGAVLATNTSALPLEDLRSALDRPGRLIGLHFFNPVSRMQLVEVVSHDRADGAALAKGRALLGAIDRLPAPVASAPGFLVNRALTPYMLEAMMMLQEGVEKETIDAAAETFGMPMGPIELADMVGLDVCAEVAESLRQRLDKPLPAPPNWLRDKVKQGALGKKTGEGFYKWRDGEAEKNAAGEPDEDMTDRLILPMIDACVECLRKDVVDDEDIADGAMIFAAGFAPFRGGPIHYARTAGAARLRARLENLAETHGERLRPDAGWDRLS